MGDEVGPPTEGKPISARSWWRWGAIVIGIGGAVLGWRLKVHIDLIKAPAQLRARIADAIARHEQVFLSDFEPTDIPESQDAVALYAQAARVLKRYGEEGISDEALVAANGEALRLCHEAVRRDGADWAKFRNGLPTIPPKLPYESPYVEVRALSGVSSVLYSSIQVAHAHHDDALAIERLNDADHFSDICQKDSLPLSRYDNRLDGSSMGCGYLVRELDIENAHQTLTAKMVKRADAKKLIDRLLDTSTVKADLRWYFFYRRAFTLNALGVTGTGASNHSLQTALDAVHVFDDVDGILHAVDQPNWSKASAVLSPVLHDIHGRGSPNVDVILRLGSMMVACPCTEPIIYYSWCAIDNNRRDATALAIRMYYLDHQSWPRRLDDLVPDYLPSVQVQGQRGDLAPIGYMIIPHGLPNGTDRPMLTASDDSPMPTPAQCPAEYQDGIWAYTHDYIGNYDWLDLAPRPADGKK